MRLVGRLMRTTHLRNQLTSFEGDQRGSVAVIMVFVGLALMGFAALAIDVGNWEANKSRLQGAADEAAYAAGFAIANGTSAAQKEGLGVMAAQGFFNGQGGVAVSVAIPPTSGSYAGTANGIQVTVSQPQQRYLSGPFLSSDPTISATAVAVPSQANACIIALAPSGTGITGSGSYAIGAPNCNVYVNSTSSCDVLLSGSVKVSGYDVYLGESSQTGCTSGSSTVSATDQLKLSASPITDPYASRVIPTPSGTCTTVVTSPATITLNPGTYCTSLVLSGTKTVNLNPGVYIFNKASLILSGAPITINGSGVTLVFTSSTGSGYGGITASGTINFNLTPMTTGPTAGMAIWLDKKGAVGLTLSGTTNLNITGAVEAPGSAVTWSGNASSTCSQLIANNITFSGASTFQHNCTGLGVSDASGGGYALVQ